MKTFYPGVAVRVTQLPHSQWSNQNGVIVQVVEREIEAGNTVQDCEVSFGSDLRWFLESHLQPVTTEPIVLDQEAAA